MFRYVGLIFRNALRNRRRSILTIGSIAVSFCIFCLLIAMYRAMFLGEATPTQALRLVVRHRVSLTQFIPIYYRDKLRQIPGVRDVMVWQWFGGTYKDSRDPNNDFPRFAVEPDRFFNVFPECQMPDDQKLAFQRERTGAIVSRSLADTLHFKIGDRITLVGDIFPVTMEFKVAGIFDVPDGAKLMYFNRDYLRESLSATSAGRDMVGAFFVQSDSAENVPKIAAAIDSAFDSSPYPTKTESERAFELSFLSFLGNIKIFLMAICAAVTFTILLVSGNTISMSVRERIREVGILKTLGFTPGAILGIVLGESAVISAIGGLVGCVLAAGMCRLVANSPGADYMPALRTMSVGGWVGLISMGSALFMGLISSVIPAWGASRTSILDALRYSG